jgi:hypothetical protein
MSGGHFNSNGYIYYRMQQFADELENDIENNDRADEYGFRPKTLEVLKRQVVAINKMAKVMRAIDYLYSSDYGEDTLLEVIRETEAAP